jgi:hypothetical protein
MAKTKISEFDTDPDLNTDINSINIAEGCAPSGINNAIRTLMSDLKEWQSGAQDIYIAPAGTAAAPSWTFNGDLDTGFYRVTANELGVAAGGSAVGRFTSAGFVGNVTGNVDGNLTAASPTAATQVAGTNNTTVATTAFVQAALNALYPVGSIYINATSSTNPGTLLGFGTWSAFGAGRVPVGFNASDPLFDSAEETGGSKDAVVVSHTHTYTSTEVTGPSASPNKYISSDVDTFVNTSVSTSPAINFSIDSTGVSGTNANLQPYITVYMWKRTA